MGATTSSGNVKRDSLMIFLFSIWSQPEVIRVLLDRCLFGRRLVMTDILDADIDGYLLGDQVDGLISSNSKSTTRTGLHPEIDKLRIYSEIDMLRKKKGGGTEWATPTRIITLSMYLSERPNLVGSLGVMHIAGMVYRSFLQTWQELLTFKKLRNITQSL